MNIFSAFDRCVSSALQKLYQFILPASLLIRLRQSAGLEQGSPTSGPPTGVGLGLLGTGCIAGGELEYNVLESSQNNPHCPGLWKNCVPRNWSLVPKRLGTTALEHTDPTSQVTLNSWFILDDKFYGNYIDDINTKT